MSKKALIINASAGRDERQGGKALNSGETEKLEGGRREGPAG